VRSLFLVLFSTKPILASFREHGKFDSTQLKALKEYLADADERRGLIAYMKKGGKSEDAKQQLYADLSETEKYMVTLMEVPDAGAKLDAMLFRNVFTNRFEDITDATRTLNSACDELRSSEKLRKLMAMILTVVNQINTGGEGKLAMGFTLDALLKLNEVRSILKIMILCLTGTPRPSNQTIIPHICAGQSFRQED
jgi:Formin Homology 2 Domain